MATEERTTEAAEDAQLMLRVQDGDEAAFARLMHRWEVPVKVVIGRLVFNAAEAEELAQETFVRLWQQRARYRAGAAVRPWIFAIAVNLARNRLRWWRRRPQVALEEWTEMPDATPRGSERLVQAERSAAVRDAIAQLPTDQREALVLFEYEHLSQAEIAAMVGASPKAIENRIHRARERLRGLLRSWQ